MEDMNLRAYTPWVIIGAVVVSVTFIVCLTVLALEGKSSEDLSRILNSGLNLVSIIVAGGAYWRSGQAAEQAGGARQEAATAAQQTNGQLDARIGAVLEDKLRAAGLLPTERA